MFSPNIQNYISTSGEAAAKARIKQLTNYVSTLEPQKATPEEISKVKPFAQVLETTKAENKSVFEIDPPPNLASVNTFGSVTARTHLTKEQIFNMIEKTAQKYGIDDKLVKAVIKQESGFNPNAKSSAGALGLMQLMPSTARGLGVVDPLNPAQNIEGGVKYLKSMLNKFNGNTILALAAYNAGPNAVEKYGSVPPYKETQNYVQSILKNYI